MQSEKKLTGGKKIAICTIEEKGILYNVQKKHVRTDL